MINNKGNYLLFNGAVVGAAGATLTIINPSVPTDIRAATIAAYSLLVFYSGFSNGFDRGKQKGANK